MGSRNRHVEPGHVYHVLNRGVRRQRLFRNDWEYAGFETLIKESVERFELPVFTYELMPNHWHFVVRPIDKYQLSDFFQHLSGIHAKRFHLARGTVGEGHVYQDRFKSCPVESDGHFFSVCRYVERNAKTSGLVPAAEDWRWGALWRRLHGCDDWLTSEWPLPRPADWLTRVNQPLTTKELAGIRDSISRGIPYGSNRWVKATAAELGISLRTVGRPRGKSPTPPRRASNQDSKPA